MNNDLKHVIVAGAGRLGQCVSHLLARTKQYQVHLCDLHVPDEGWRSENLICHQSDMTNFDQIKALVEKHPIKAVASCLPYFCNQELATNVKKLGLSYFDLTEDVSTTNAIRKLAKDSDQAFVPQCGLAPGLIGIVGNYLMSSFTHIESAKLRTGALPQYSNNTMRYAFTWSIDGLINEYAQPCVGIERGKILNFPPLDGLENLQVDGIEYEAFNTSGGLATLYELYEGKIDTLNYKSIRYPGHCQYMSFLMNDLKMRDDQETLKSILQNAIPFTQQDVVVLYVSVKGNRNGRLDQETVVLKFYPQEIDGHTYTALQLTTAYSLTTAIDMVLNNPEKYKGFVHQHDISWEDYLANQFGGQLKNLLEKDEWIFKKSLQD